MLFATLDFSSPSVLFALAVAAFTAWKWWSDHREVEAEIITPNPDIRPVSLTPVAPNQVAIAPTPKPSPKAYPSAAEAFEALQVVLGRLKAVGATHEECRAVENLSARIIADPAIKP